MRLLFDLKKGVLWVFLLAAAGCVAPGGLSVSSRSTPQSEAQRSASQSPREEKSRFPRSKKENSRSDRAIFLFNQAQDFIRQGDRKKGEALLREVLAANPKLFPAHLELGDLLQKEGRLSEAVKSYRRVLALRADHAVSRISLGRIAEKRKMPERALFQYEQAVEIAPDTFYPHFRLGVLRRSKGQLDLAIFHLKKAVRFDGDHRAARYWLWLSAAERGGLDVFEIKHGKFLVERGDETPIRYYQAQAANHFASKRFRQALREIRKAIDVNPRWKEPRWQGVLNDLSRYKRATKQE